MVHELLFVLGLLLAQSCAALEKRPPHACTVVQKWKNSAKTNVCIHVVTSAVVSQKYL